VRVAAATVRALARERAATAASQARAVLQLSATPPPQRMLQHARAGSHTHARST